MFERRVLLCFVTLVVILIYINYILLRGDKEEEQYAEHGFEENANRSYGVAYSCCNVLFCAIEGEWVLRPNVTSKDRELVRKSNTQLRVRKGWPTILFNNNSRCGGKYPIPRTLRRNGTNIAYPDIASQCDSLRTASCCREDVGLCGQGSSFCDCNSCTDYKKFLYAELSTWKSYFQCEPHELSSNDTCSFLSEKYTSITFIGDSLVRHAFSALLMKLTNDREYGGLKYILKHKDRDFCKGENQFVDSSCHVKLATKWQEIQQNPNYCYNVGDKVKISFIQAYSSHHKHLAIESIEDVLRERRPLILVGIGIHDNFNATKVIKNFLQPILDIRFPYKTSNPVLIWLNTHAAGPLKPIEFQETQGNTKILKYNAAMRQYCERNSLLLFDTYNLTKNIHSFDGTHYGSVLNLFKIDLLMTALKSIA